MKDKELNMTCGIYLITNKINGHMYVGQSNNIEQRFDQHQWCHDVEDMAIDRAILKYGSDNFTYDIIEELPNNIDILHEREKYWIKFYNTYEDRNHYNLTPGGEGFGSGEEHPRYIHLDNNIILEKARSGMIPIEIGNELGVGRHTITRRLQKVMSEEEYKKYVNNNRNMRCSVHHDFIIKKYKDGYSINSIARELNINKETVRRYLKKVMPEEEYKKYLKRKKDLDINKILDLVNQGVNITTIAKRMNVSIPTIRHRLKEIMSEEEYRKYVNSSGKKYDEILALANKNFSIILIVQELGISYSTVKRCLEKNMSKEQYNQYVNNSEKFTINGKMKSINYDKMLELARQGMTVYDICKRINVHEGTVRRNLKKMMSEEEYKCYKSKNISKSHIKNNKSKKKTNKRKKIDYNQILDLANKKLSPKQISKRLKISDDTVRRFLKKNMSKEDYFKYSNYNHNKSINTSGYYRVSKYNSNRYKQGYTWCYKYPSKDGKRLSIYALDLKELEKKVKDKNLLWKKI